MENQKLKPNKKLIEEAWRNPFILQLKEYIEAQGENFPHYLCYKTQHDTGERCVFPAHIRGVYQYKKKLECKCQVQGLLTLHFQSKHLTGERLKALLAKLEEHGEEK